MSAFLLALWLARPISLITADLGRHLRNGEIILIEGFSSSVLDTNYYSYTHPDFPAINHHWLYGVLSALLWRAGGFPLLSVINLALIVSGVVVVLFASRATIPSASSWSIFVATLISLPLLVSRTEIRPESLSFIFLALYLSLLLQWRKNGKLRWILPLIPLQIIWTNSHIFFVFGWLIVGTFLLESIWKNCRRRFKKQEDVRQLRSLGIIFVLILLASLVTPFSWKLALAPLMIATNYNYLVAENQSPLFLFNLRVNQQLHGYAMLFMFGVFVALLTLFIRTKLRHSLFPLWAICTIFLIGSTQIMRLYPYLALVAIPLLGVGFHLFFQKFSRGKRIVALLSDVTSASIIALSSALLLALFILSGLFIPDMRRIGIGLTPESERAGKFFRDLKVTGRVFNNYDSGGYLIYYLPTQSVYVDNRPAEYPSSFFDEYKRAQTDPAFFSEISTKYDLGSIFFFRHDMTPEAQLFLISLIDNHEWVPIFVDEAAIIFVKQIPEHAQIISSYQLPRSTFGVSQN